MPSKPKQPKSQTEGWVEAIKDSKPTPSRKPLRSKRPLWAVVLKGRRNLDGGIMRLVKEDAERIAGNYGGRVVQVQIVEVLDAK
jgi:hypothetical protein